RPPPARPGDRRAPGGDPGQEGPRVRPRPRDRLHQGRRRVPARWPRDEGVRRGRPPVRLDGGGHPVEAVLKRSRKHPRAAKSRSWKGGSRRGRIADVPGVRSEGKTMTFRTLGRILSALVLGCTLTASWASVEVQGVALDETVTVGGQQLALNGAGYRKRGYFK